MNIDHVFSEYSKNVPKICPREESVDHFYHRGRSSQYYERRDQKFSKIFLFSLGIFDIKRMLE